MNERNPRFDLFLSYNRLDRRLVDPLAEALLERGLKVFKDDWYLRPGEPWPAALERNLTARSAVIGERLYALGDPRRGVGVHEDGTPDINWCAVSGGEASIEVEGRGLRKPVEDFHIARYPVTATQYRAFIEADDVWRDRRWWREDPSTTIRKATATTSGASATTRRSTCLRELVRRHGILSLARRTPQRDRAPAGRMGVAAGGYRWG